MNRALIFTRGLFGLYGFGSVEVVGTGVKITWSGWLIRVKDQVIEWDEIKSIKLQGSRIRIQQPGRLGQWNLFIRNSNEVDAGLKRWAPARLLGNGVDIKSTQ